MHLSKEIKTKIIQNTEIHSLELINEKNFAFEFLGNDKIKIKVEAYALWNRDGTKSSKYSAKLVSEKEIEWNGLFVSKKIFEIE